jgi:hypothetical protein
VTTPAEAGAATAARERADAAIAIAFMPELIFICGPPLHFETLIVSMARAQQSGRRGG